MSAQSSNPYSTPESNLVVEETYTPNIFSTSGRIGRLRYIAYSMLALVLMYVGIACSALFENVFGALISVVAMFGAMALIVMFAKRRFNDLNCSGWFALLTLIPVVGIFANLWLLLGSGTSGTNKFGATPCKNPMSVAVVGGVVPVFVIAGILAAVAIPQYSSYTERAAEYQASID